MTRIPVALEREEIRRLADELRADAAMWRRAADAMTNPAVAKTRAAYAERAHKARERADELWALYRPEDQS